MVKKKVVILLLLICLDVLLWFLIFYTKEPVIFDGLTNLFIVIFISVINVAIGSICIKRKNRLSIVFFINAIIVVVIMDFLFDKYSEAIDKMLYQKWEFSIDNKNYRITRYVYELFPTYNAYDICQFEKGGEFSIKDGIGNYGIVTTNKDSIFFHGEDSSLFFIHNNYLYNYAGIDSVKIILP